MDLMIDIETLGVQPSAVIIQIGAVIFDCYDEKRPPVVFNEFCHVTTQIRHGRTVDISTLQFWKRHGFTLFKWRLHTARSALLSAVLTKFASFCSTHKFKRVWANSPQFDLIILENAFAQARIRIPWTYRQMYDVRTLKFVGPPISFVNQRKHDAVEDALHQVQVVQVLIKQLQLVGVP